MRLITSTKEYQIPGLARPGFPILLWNDMNSCREANEFLRQYLMQGSIASQRSWEPIGRALYDYFGYLESNDLNWRDVGRGEHKNLPAAYRDYCGEVFGHRRNTIRLRLTYVFQFYEYALNKSWIERLPYTYQERRSFNSKGFLSHLDVSGGKVSVPSPMPRKRTSTIKFLSIADSRRLVGEAKNVHHKTIIKFFLRSGLRRAELATFPLPYVFDPDERGIRTKNVSILLDPQDGTGMKTKGSKERTIWIPREMMKELSRYAKYHRGERASLSECEQSQLFLSQKGVAFADDGKSIEVIIREIGQRIGIKIHPHMLRHTYATHTLNLLQRAKRQGNLEPLVFLQNQLGHASIEQTRKYLHLVKHLADDAVLDYDRELNREGS